MLDDHIDQSIVAALTEDARLSFAAIGERIGLSPSAVKRRVDRLVDQGAIRSFTITVDPAVDGHDTEAFVEVFCRPRTRPQSIEAIVSPFAEVVGAYTVTGEADALLHLRCGGVDGLEGVLERIRADPAVERTRSVIVLSRLVERA